MMKLVVGLLAASALLAGPVSAATPKPTVAAQLRVYMAKMQKPVRKLELVDQGVDSASFIYQQEGESTFVVSLLDKASANAPAVPALLSAVKAPAAMRGPHALLVQGAKTFARKIAPDAAKADAADLSQPLSLLSAVDDASIAQVGVHEIEKNWRDELVVQLRRAQITVPLWVKQVGG